MYRKKDIASKDAQVGPENPEGLGTTKHSHTPSPSSTARTSQLQAHLQHRWKTLSAPSDSDFMVSHTAFASLHLGKLNKDEGEYVSKKFICV